MSAPPHAVDDERDAAHLARLMAVMSLSQLRAYRSALDGDHDDGIVTPEFYRSRCAAIDAEVRRREGGA